jgi:hypothetical protein
MRAGLNWQIDLQAAWTRPLRGDFLYMPSQRAYTAGGIFYPKNSERQWP